MDQALQNQLFEKYPDLFINRTKTPMESCMSWGIETGNGWYDILSSLCWRIQDHEKNVKQDLSIEITGEHKDYFPVKFDQIKEKFGGLRIYYSGGDDYIDGAISMAEEISYKICEVCGNTGRPNKHGWISTRCEAHRNS